MKLYREIYGAGLNGGISMLPPPFQLPSLFNKDISNPTG